MTHEDATELVCIGEFGPPEAEDVLDRFSELGLPFEIEREDSAIRELTPFAAGLGGTFGHGARILIHVPRSAEKQAQQVLSEMFPEQA